MDENILGEIYKKHFKRFKNLRIPNRKLLICFGAIPGSGKTHISKILERRYNAIRINNDYVRKIIDNVIEKHSNLKRKDKQPILENYLFYVLKRHNYPNGLVILDSSIDRLYKEVSFVALETGFDMFVIDVHVTKETLMTRIRKRNKRSSKDYFKELNRWYREHKDFENNVVKDIVLVNESKLNLQSLFVKLDKCLKK